LIFEMLMQKSSVRIGILLSVLVGILPVVPAQADSPRLTAVLSNSQVRVGETVQMQIRVTGARDAKPPSEIAVDGLEIHATGTSQQFEMHNFDMTSSVTYSYTILPLKAGAFTIPAQTVRVGSTSLQTPELRLAVVGSGAPAGRNPGNSGAQNSQSAAGKIAFAELLVPKKTAYVGEMIPVVIRLGFFTRANVVEPPHIEAQGFTTQKLQMPDQPQIQTINGRDCLVFSYKTAIAAVRPGKFEIAPIKATAIVAMPRQRQSNSRGRSPFDIFNMDDPFSDPSLNSLFGGYTQQPYALATEAAALEIKPLPGNAPADFSGAIGNFSMSVDANPKTVGLGDPITVTATLAGRGNFDRVSAPLLEDDRGWHKYPPSAKFKQDDDVGISGSKTFDTVLSPNEKKQAIPPLRFTFFDPAKEQYVTLKSDPIPVRTEGGTAPAPPPAASAPSAQFRTPPAAAASPTPAPAQQDILYQLTERPARAQAFTPLYMRRTFWAVQLAPLLVLLGFIAWKVRQARRQDRAARRTAALQHEVADLIRTLRKEGTSPQEYYTRASRAIRVKTALAMKIDPNIVDADAVAAAFHLDEASRQQLQRLFERSDEVRYSGDQNGNRTVPSEHRRETLELIESLRS
jgi:BatD DUF11 like domain